MKKLLPILICLFSLQTILAQSTAFQWAKQMGGIGGDVGYAVTTDALGNVYTTGYFTGTADFDPSLNTFTLAAPFNKYDIFISKLDALGNFVWAKQIAVSSNTVLSSVSVDASGNVYTIGSFTGTVDFDSGAGTYTLSSAGSSDVFILKLDASGNFVWARKLGNVVVDYGNAIALDAQKNVYTTGSFVGTVDFDPGVGTYSLTGNSGGFTAFVSKLDSLGNFVWAKQLKGNSFYSISVGRFIKGDALGNVFTAGIFEDTLDFDPGPGIVNIGTGTRAIFISKLDASGNFVWAKKLGANTNNDVNSLAIDALGNIYTTGCFLGIGDFDPGIGTQTITSVGGKDIFISKLDANGNFVWIKAIGGIYDDYGRSIAVDASNNVYTFGSFRYAADFDPGIGTALLGTNGNSNAFISKLDAAGNYVWVEKLGITTSSTDGYSMVLDVNNNIYTTGCFDGNVDFDNSVNTFTLNCNSNYFDVFVHKMGQTAVGIKENFDLSRISIFPNPTNEIINIKLDVLNGENLKIQIVNILGRVVMEEISDSQNFSFNLQQFNNGLYFVTVLNNDNTILTKKIIKQ